MIGPFPSRRNSSSDMASKSGNASRAKSVGILCQQRWRDDPRLVFSLFEMRIGEEKKQGREGMLVEEIREKLHSIGADNRDILIFAFFGDTECSDAILNILRYLDPDFHA
ncbi:unnamed protein product, partial [Mycena citricolor]